MRISQQGQIVCVSPRVLCEAALSAIIAFDVCSTLSVGPCI